MIRAFVGLPVPEHIVDAMVLAQAGLDAGKLVPRENFHVTLAFLGEHPQPVLEDLHGLLEGIDMTPLSLRVLGMDVFGGGRPRALFAEIVADERLTRLRKSIRHAARQAGIDLSHEKFRPHITLARFGAFLAPEEHQALDTHLGRRLHRVDETFLAETFALFESRLGRHAPSYTILAEYPSA